MLTNYFKIALRTILKFKGYAFINLLGLALGLTAGILIMIYVLDELSFDKFHTKASRIYRVDTAFGPTGPLRANSANGWPVGKVLEKDYPEVESVVYLKSGTNLLVNYNEKNIRQRIYFTNPEFLDMFSFPVLKGDPKTLLNNPYSIVITEDMEKKFFAGESALSKSLVLSDTLQFVVTGVIANFPSNSHIQFDMLISFSTYPVINPYFNFEDGWGNINMGNYVLLKENTDVAAFSAKAKDIYTTGAGDMLKQWGTTAAVLFEPLQEIYLRSNAGNPLGPQGSIDRVYLLSGIAGFVILLACINFINLATARSTYRAKEVGLRKVVGSSRRGLISQFLGESFVLTTLSLFIALLLISILLPLFNTLLSKNYQLMSLASVSIIGGVIALVVLVAFFAGYYPAMVISALKPVEVLKGKMQSSARGVRLRRGLVIFQFVISATLVVGTFIVLDQLEYMQKQELGFDKDQILVVNAGQVRSQNSGIFETMKNELKSLASVDDVTYTNALPGHQGWSGQVAYPEGRSGDDATSVEYMAIDEDYLKTLGLNVLEGRGFSRDRAADLAEGIILNETAVAAFGWSSAKEAIGKKITSPSGYPAGEVIGVVKDYHQVGLQQKIGPMAMDYSPQNSYMYAIRYKAADTKLLLEQAQSVWAKTFPNYDFNYFFLDQDFETQYQAEQRLANVFGLFAGITIVIAVIGLIGLVSFTVVAKTKEIGVRKVLGAGVFNITQLLTKEFVVLVVTANVLSIPVAWYFATQWLQNFAYRTAVNPMLFVWTMLISVSITLVAVGYQTVRAASANPVKSLRYE